LVAGSNPAEPTKFFKIVLDRFKTLCYNTKTIKKGKQMPLICVLVLFVTPFSFMLAGLNPLINESARLLIWDLWFDKGIPLNIGLSLGLIMGAELQKIFQK
tara:strand:+ start:332 stop:634 length:303 start_codon:yes stop_codon:yes gene_type:complete